MSEARTQHGRDAIIVVAVLVYSALFLAWAKLTPQIPDQALAFGRLVCLAGSYQRKP